MADILAHEIVARDADHDVVAADVARARCRIWAIRCATVVLPVPGLPVKLMCSDGGSACMPMRATRPLDEQQGGDLPDAGFDRLQSDEIAVERPP